MRTLKDPRHSQTSNIPLLVKHSRWRDPENSHTHTHTQRSRALSLLRLPRGRRPCHDISMSVLDRSRLTPNKSFCQKSTYQRPLSLVLRAPAQRCMHKKLHSARGLSVQSNSGLDDSHFVCEGWGRGLAGSQDHDDEDGDEEES